MEKTRKENQVKNVFWETSAQEDFFDEAMADINHATHKAGLDQ